MTGVMKILLVADIKMSLVVPAGTVPSKPPLMSRYFLDPINMYSSDTCAEIPSTSSE